MAVVCLSVCPVPDPKSRKEGRRKLKIGSKEDHDTGDPIYKSKNQRLRSPLRLTPWPNISHIFQTGRPTNFKLGVHGVPWPASPTCAVTSKLRALDGCSSHHLQGAGTHCGGRTTGRTDCCKKATMDMYTVIPLTQHSVLAGRWTWVSRLPT